MITHAEYVGTNIDDQTLLLFRRINPTEAKFVILESSHYRDLIREAEKKPFCRLCMDGRAASIHSSCPRCGRKGL